MSYLKGFDSIFDLTLSNEIQDNIVEFFDWGLLEKGNYFNVNKDEVSYNNTDYSRLSPSESNEFEEGQAWESYRKNWVWQSGIDYNPAPIVGNNNAIPGISGVYIDDVFYASDTTGEYSHYVDYANGRIVFNSAISTSSKVQAEYSYKYISTIYANEVPWLREIQYRTLDLNKIDNSSFTLPPEMRIQLPAIAVEVVPRRTMKGFQLGGGQWVYTDVLFHCIAEDEITRNNLIDIVSFQNDKNIVFFDSDSVVKSGDAPLDYRGVPVSGALRYPELVSTHSSFKAQFTNSNVQGMELINSNFYTGIVRSTLEVILTKI